MKLNQYLDSMAVSSCGGEIARLVSPNIELQQQPYGSAPWKIGEGFMHLDNMFLVRLENTSKGSWQPDVFVLDPTI